MLEDGYGGTMLIREYDRDDGTGERPFLLNVVETPLYAEMASSTLRLVDGALVVTDIVEGLTVRQETMLRNALTARVKPCILVDGILHKATMLNWSPEEVYMYSSRAIDSTNVVIATYNDELMGDVQALPEKGTVAFGETSQGWAFTLDFFADMYAAKLGVFDEKMRNRLWGDNFFVARKWRTEGDAKSRGFNQFVIAAIQTLAHAVQSGDDDKTSKMLQALKIKLDADTRDLEPQKKLVAVMQAWLGTNSLFGMLVAHLPSPKKAQKYRVQNLYTGPMDDAAADAMRRCDPSGPLMLYVRRQASMPSAACSPAPFPKARRCASRGPATKGALHRTCT